jgi:hypothetical protein
LVLIFSGKGLILLTAFSDISFLGVSLVVEKLFALEMSLKQQKHELLKKSAQSN